MLMQFNPEDVPPGWGFHPNDQQLLSYYSKLKELLTHPNPYFDIKVIPLGEYDPWDLFAKFKKNSGGKEMYFFTPCEYHKKTGQRKRKAGSGNWKCTGVPRYIIGEDGDVIGRKRTLVFQNPYSTTYRYSITEYTEGCNLPFRGDHVLCKLKIKPQPKKAKQDCKKARPKKKARKTKFSDANQASEQMVANSTDGEGEPSNCMTSYPENQYLNYDIPIYDRSAEPIPQHPIVDDIPKNISLSPNVFDTLSDIYAIDNLFNTTAISTNEEGESFFQNLLDSLSDETAVSAHDKDESVSLYLSDDPYSTFDNAESILMPEHHKHEDAYRKYFCLGNQNADEMTANSSHENADTLAPMKSPDFNNQNQY